MGEACRESPVLLVADISESKVGDCGTKSVVIMLYGSLWGSGDVSMISVMGDEAGKGGVVIIWSAGVD